MTSSTHTVQEPPPAPLGPDPLAPDLAEAARYALLRRLAPSMRHHLVVNLQPIGMIYEVMERRLRGPEPNLAEVHDSAHKINGFARAALDSCLDIVTWLAPEDDVSIPVDQGVAECLSLLATSLTFCGFSLRNEVTPLSGEVCRCAIRNVLAAALLCIADEGQPPADLVLSAERSASALLLTLTLRPTQGDKGCPPEASYRALDWSDVQALAAAESVQLARESGSRVRLSIPWVTGPRTT